MWKFCIPKGASTGTYKWITPYLICRNNVQADIKILILCPPKYILGKCDSCIRYVLSHIHIDCLATRYDKRDHISALLMVECIVLRPLNQHRWFGLYTYICLFLFARQKFGCDLDLSIHVSDACTRNHPRWMACWLLTTFPSSTIPRLLASHIPVGWNSVVLLYLFPWACLYVPERSHLSLGGLQELLFPSHTASMDRTPVCT
jgi:hypothetical protein